MPNGGRHTQRLFAVDSGPEKVGLGSWVSTRFSAANVDDVRILLHPAGTFTPAPGPETLYACEKNADCLGDAPGVPLPLTRAMSGNADDAKWSNVTVRFELFKPVAEGGLGCTIREDDRRFCPGSNGVPGPANTW